jgi:hypothetical protein
MALIEQSIEALDLELSRANPAMVSLSRLTSESPIGDYLQCPIVDAGTNRFSLRLGQLGSTQRQSDKTSRRLRPGFGNRTRRQRVERDKSPRLRHLSEPNTARSQRCPDSVLPG